MRTQETKKFLDAHNIVPLVADFSQYDTDIGDLLVALGNKVQALPFYAIIPPDDRPPIVFNDALLTQSNLLGYLEQAVESGAPQTAMAVDR